MYPLYWTKPVEGDFLCATVMNSKETVLICIVKDVGQRHQKVSIIKKTSVIRFVDGFAWKMLADQKVYGIKNIIKIGLPKNDMN